MAASVRVVSCVFCNTESVTSRCGRLTPCRPNRNDWLSDADQIGQLMPNAFPKPEGLQRVPRRQRGMGSLIFIVQRQRLRVQKGPILLKVEPVRTRSFRYRIVAVMLQCDCCSSRQIPEVTDLSLAVRCPFLASRHPDGKERCCARVCSVGTGHK